MLDELLVETGGLNNRMNVGVDARLLIRGFAGHCMGPADGPWRYGHQLFHSR